MEAAIEPKIVHYSKLTIAEYIALKEKDSMFGSPCFNYPEIRLEI